MDLLIFGGQSNMQGQTSACPCDSPVEDAQEYCFLSDSFRPLRHPVGEDMPQGLLLGAHEGCGTLVPDFCRAYQQYRPGKTTVVHAARGATTVADWHPDGARFRMAMEKIIACKNALGEIPEKIYYIWLQGESDALAGTSSEEYFRRLVCYKNALKEQAGIDRFGIIRVGYFTHCYMQNSNQNDEAIMEAQERAVREDADFCMLTRVASWVSMDARFMNPAEIGHYNNMGMALLGAVAGETLGRIAVEQ